MMRIVSVLLLGIVVVSAMPGTSTSEPFVHITACDSVSINGQTYPRITFDIVSAHPQFGIQEFVIRPVSNSVPEDTCHVLQITAPQPWQVWMFDDVIGVYADDPSAWLHVGERLTGVKLVQSKFTCCYELQFFAAFEGPHSSERICFKCDLATPTVSSTWGRLKQQYR